MYGFFQGCGDGPPGLCRRCYTFSRPQIKDIHGRVRGLSDVWIAQGNDGIHASVPTSLHPTTVDVVPRLSNRALSGVVLSMRGLLVGDLDRVRSDF